MRRAETSQERTVRVFDKAKVRTEQGQVVSLFDRQKFVRNAQRRSIQDGFLKESDKKVGEAARSVSHSLYRVAIGNTERPPERNEAGQNLSQV